MELIDHQLLDELSVKAKGSERLRMNYNFHTSADAASQRLLNALEPGTVVPIHRHRHTSETYILLRGRMRVSYYDAKGLCSESVELNPLEGRYGVNIPVGQWHSVEVLEAGSVMLECKDGPYAPLGPEDIISAD